jgi:hypothetical protein
MLTARLLEVSVRVYKGLLLVYPAEHRREYGPLMVRLFGDLCRDAIDSRSVFGLVRLWVRTLWDVVVTAVAEHKNAGVAGIENLPVTPLPWWQVGLAILPGLLTVGQRSGVFRVVFGQEFDQMMVSSGLPMVALFLVLGGCIIERRLATWSFPALGILFFTLPGAVMDLTFGLSSGPPPPAHTWVTNLWFLGVAGVGVAVLVHRRHTLCMPKLGWALVAMFVLTGPFLFWFMGLLLLLPLAVGLLATRRSSLLAALIVVGTEFWLVDEIYDPGYAMLMWSSNHVAARVVSALPALVFLVIAPLWVLRARSTWGRMGGVLLPPLVGLVSGEVIRSVVFLGTPGEYTVGMWLLRGGGALQFVVALALAALIYLRSENRAGAVVTWAVPRPGK